MTELSTKWTKAEISRIHDSLARVLASPVFSQSARQQRFLGYIVKEMLGGRADRLKGYTIGVEVFDRGPGFDPRVDAIVRVQAALLRSKLREYYDGEGRFDPVRIELPKGGYTVRILFRSPEASEKQPTEPGSRAGVAAPPMEDKPSLAVLPFTNMSPEAGHGYFADGITDDLITELSRLSGLLVISRHSSFVYKNVPRRAEEIGRELGVKYLLEGSVQRSGERVRINVQLVDAASGIHRWAERYDSRLSDLFAFQDEVTRRVASVLQVRFTSVEDSRLGHEGTVSMEAHEALLRGLESYWLFTPEGTGEARAHFTRAVTLDPAYAAGHAWLARVLLFRWIMMWEPDPEILDRAYREAHRAVALNPHVAYAHAVLGWTELWRKHGNAAIEAGRRAVALDPNNADAHLFLTFSLSAAGRAEEALHYIQKGIRLNPHPSTVYQLALGLCLFLLEEYDTALAAFKRGTGVTDVFIPNHVWLCILYTQLGRDVEARTERDKVRALTGGRTPPTRSMDIWLKEDLRLRMHGLLQRAGLE